ncbi:Uncharacterised protein [Mycobacterium tuberculosis]|nr:Uncharacterised protein [Mycobacterium tuberculosis]
MYVDDTLCHAACVNFWAAAIRLNGFIRAIARSTSSSSTSWKNTARGSSTVMMSLSMTHQSGSAPSNPNNDSPTSSTKPQI